MKTLQVIPPKLFSVILRTSIIVGLIMGLEIVAVQAQNRPMMTQNPTTGIDTILSRLTKQLNLSKDQQSKIKTILNDRVDSWKKMRNETKKLRQNMQDQLDKVLNKDQIAELQKMRDQRHSAFHKWMKSPDRHTRHHQGMWKHHEHFTHHFMSHHEMGNMNNKSNIDAWVYMALAHMTQRLDLSSKQQNQVKGILTESIQQHQKLWQQMADQRKKTRQQMMDVLNKDQVAKYQKMKDWMKSRKNRSWSKKQNWSRMWGNNGRQWNHQSAIAFMMNRLKKRLNLTQSQEEKVRKIIVQHMQEQKKTWKNGQMGTNNWRSQWEKSQQELANKLEGVLNSEQLKEFKKMQEEWHSRMMNMRN